MFEVIGVVAVVWIGIVLINKFTSNAVRGIQIQAVDYAVRQGVPRDFAVETAADKSRLGATVKIFLREVPQFSEHKGAMRYGAAISLLYGMHLEEQERNRSMKLMALKPKLREFIRPQIEKLEREGIFISISEATYAYIAGLVFYSINELITPEQMNDLAKDIFKGKVIDGAFLHTYYLVKHRTGDFEKTLAATMPISQRELIANKCEFVFSEAKRINS
jgi:hypothetical protein